MISFILNKHFSGLGCYPSQYHCVAVSYLTKLRKLRLKVLMDLVLSNRGVLRPNAASMPLSHHAPYMNNVLNMT